MQGQLIFENLPPKERKPNLKRQWENGFQRWSDENSQDGLTPLGKCGYSTICDFCKDNAYGRPCVRALNAMCKDRKISIDYAKRNYEEIWNV